jgi:hypothetical protein
MDRGRGVEAFTGSCRSGDSSQLWRVVCGTLPTCCIVTLICVDFSAKIREFLSRPSNDGTGLADVAGLVTGMACGETLACREGDSSEQYLSATW